MNTMILNSTVDLAKRKLEEHFKMGSNSKLSIFEVASLKDQILNHSEFACQDNRKLFFNFSNN